MSLFAEWDVVSVGRLVGLCGCQRTNRFSRSNRQAESLWLALHKFSLLWRVLGMDWCQWVAGREKTHILPLAFTPVLKKMLKQDVFKGVLEWINLSLHTLFTYLIALTTESEWLISDLDFQAYFCIALVSNWQTSVASFSVAFFQLKLLSEIFSQ